MTGPASEEWLPVRELRGLAGLPRSKSHLIDRLTALGVRSRWTPGNGGNRREYCVADLPKEVKSELRNRAAGISGSPGNAHLWEEFERRPLRTRQKAIDDLQIVLRVEELVQAGLSTSAAVKAVEAETGRHRATIYRLRQAIRGMPRQDWLPALARKHGGGREPTYCSPEALEAFKSDYLRGSKPSWESCYERLLRVVALRGWTVPSLATLKRRVLKEVTQEVIVLAREGEKALDRMLPPQIRDRSVFYAGQALVFDGSTRNIWVEWPDGEIRRPIVLGVNDLYSGKTVACRVDKTENSDLVRLAAGDAFAVCGVPEDVYFDNGRAFASKLMTGGMRTRFRFKIKFEDPAGVFTNLGVRVHWSTPGHGQSKPIERTWRDFCERIDKHPAFEGAYVGSNALDKPHNYGTRVVKYDQFIEVLASEVEAHNKRQGRRTPVCRGRSFDDVFYESLAQHPPRVLAPSQRRYFLLAAEGVKAHAESGAVELHGNRYWCEALRSHRGKKLIVRFNPQDLTKPVLVETLGGQPIAEAPRQGTVGYNDTQAAREVARAKRELRKITRAKLKAQRKLAAAELAAMQPAPAAPTLVEAKVVQPFRPPEPVRKNREAEPESEAMEAGFQRTVADIAAKRRGEHLWRSVG